MPRHQDALSTRGTPNQRVAVAATATDHTTTAKKTTGNTKEAISPVHHSTAKDVPTRPVQGVASPPPEREREAIAHATIAKEATSSEKEATVHTTTGKVATSSEKDTISHERDTISHERDTSRERGISLAAVTTMPQREGQEEVSVHALPIIILMSSTA